MAIPVVPAMPLVTSTGTTAPFSAISGALMVMSLESAGAFAPMFFSASPTFLASKALRGTPARAWVGFSRPAATATATVPAPAAPFSTFLRSAFIWAYLLIEQCNGYLQTVYEVGHFIDLDFRQHAVLAERNHATGGIGHGRVPDLGTQLGLVGVACAHGDQGRSDQTRGFRIGYSRQGIAGQAVAFASIKRNLFAVENQDNIGCERAARQQKNTQSTSQEKQKQLSHG